MIVTAPDACGPMLHSLRTAIWTRVQPGKSLVPADPTDPDR
jgi:hypothetical protein